MDKPILCKDCKPWHECGIYLGEQFGICHKKDKFIQFASDTCDKAERKDEDGTLGGKR